MNFFIWIIVIISVAGVLLRPRGIPEWVAASLGAAALVLLGLLSPSAALAAIARGNDVYAFLGGMMLLAEAARRSGLFDWVAAWAVRAAGGSRWRLFTLVYIAGVAVTVVLSNDATAVVLTPAVAAAARRARVAPRPYLFACALVANAASFVLPISNPANLVVFGATLPPLGTWLGLFALPSIAAIVMTFVALGFVSRTDLRGPVSDAPDPQPLGLTGRMSLAAIAATALALIIASGRGAALGVTTALAALIALIALAIVDRPLVTRVFGGVTWSVLPLVAGLFMLVAAVDRTGVLAAGHRAVLNLDARPPMLAALLAGGGTALLTNLTNNLPAGLLAGVVLGGTSHGRTIAAATAIGIDLGPNLSVGGSLATVLWIAALRRDGVTIGALEFLRVGAIVMPPALIAALLLASVGSSR